MDIINKIEKSGLITLDLSDYFPQGNRSEIDIKDFLWQGEILKEKEFREAINQFDWEQYRDHYIALFCSEDIIVANWAYMIIVSKLHHLAKKIVFGSIENLEDFLFNESLASIDLKEFIDKRILIKGCGSVPTPTSAYVKIVTLLQPVVKSLMYGEACSSVPVYKAKK